MHLQRLQHVTHCFLSDELLRLGPRERDIALREERRNISTCNLTLGVLFALQLT